MDYRVILLVVLEAAFAAFLLWRGNMVTNLKRCITAALLLALSFCLRIFVLDHETADYTDFLRVWVDFFRQNGGFSALNRSIGNYNIPYLYFMALFSYSSIMDLYLIKLLSIFFDVILAYSVSRIAGAVEGASSSPKAAAASKGSLTAFFAVILWPTVFLNGALWGQCDSIYAALALLALWLMLCDRPVAAMAALAVSFGFKLQAVFIMPVFSAFLFNGKLKPKHLPVFPLTYVLLVLPAVLAGRPFWETITLYFNQTGSIGSGLNYNSPSVFAFWDFSSGINTEGASKTGIIAAFSYMLVVLFYMFRHRKNISRDMIIILAAMLSLGIPFLLPHMHDRYFFGADITALTAALIMPDEKSSASALHGLMRIFAALLVEFASLLGYGAYLLGRYILFMRWGAAANILALLILFIQLWYSRRTAAALPEQI